MAKISSRKIVAIAPGLVTLAATAAVVAALYFARAVLIPIALAALLTFLLTPLVRRLEAWGLGRLPAVAAVALIAIAPVLAVGWLVAIQFVDVVNTVPEYRDNIRAKLQSVRGPTSDFMGRFSETIEELSRPEDDFVGPPDLRAPPREEPSSPPPAPAAEETEPPTALAAEDDPVPVQVVPNQNQFDALRAMVGPILRPAATAGIIIVFVIFMLINREDLRDRMIRLLSNGELTVTTQALDELGERISRFLRALFILNASFGAAIALGLWVIGLPNPLFWGFMAFALRFIPYAGPVTAAALPIALSLIVSDGWALPLKTAGLILVLEIVSNNFMEPWLYGRRTGVSMLAVLVAAVFWTWLWGLPGLLLATPMTVCLVVAGRYVPQLSFLHVLLSDEPIMEPRQRLYQRLLATDPDEASDIAEEYLKEHTLAALFEDVLIPALRFADQDRERGTLDPDKQQFVHQAIRDLVEESLVMAPAAPEPAEGARPGEAARVLCVPARDEADAVAAVMLQALLQAEGMSARALSLDELGNDLTVVAREFEPDVICISAVPPFASTQARFRYKQVRRKTPDARIVVGLWSVPVEAGRLRQRLEAIGIDAVTGSLEDAVQKVRSWASEPRRPGVPRRQAADTPPSGAQAPARQRVAREPEPRR